MVVRSSSDMWERLTLIGSTLPFEVAVGVSGRHGVEHLVVYFETAVDSRLLIGQFIVVLISLIALSDAGVMEWYVSHLPELSALGSLW